MLVMILSFLFLFGVFFFGIKALIESTKEEKWRLTKFVGYSILCALLTLIALTVYVLIF